MKQSLLSEELQKMQENGSRTFKLADLVMVQMTGDLEELIARASTMGSDGSGFSDANKVIEETREKVTTEKLFTGIVDKTIRAQFGEKHSAIRELGQNGIDSYEPYDKEKRVVFDLGKENKHLILRVRDYGSAMSMETIIRDLLIPYNSGKEFDVNKIGEHGIGWYSTVDLAEFAKVTSRKKGNVKASQALVFKDDSGWKVALGESDDGFFQKLHWKNHGTEVSAYIPISSGTNAEKIRDYLFQYLGMVGDGDAQVYFEGEKINSLRENYMIASPVAVKIKNTSRYMRMGASRREIHGELSDPRFKHRNQNLEKILYTQRGLFINNFDIPFDEKTPHYALARDLITMGLDFWADIPDNVTLTKGRNEIVSEHYPAVLEGMYKSFENLFLDVLLGDEELLRHPSQFLMSAVGNAFERDYKNLVEHEERVRNYTFKRRAVSGVSSVVSGGIDVAKFLGVGGAMVAGAAAKYPFTRMGSDIKRGYNGTVDFFRDNKEDFVRLSKKVLYRGVPALCAIGGLVYLFGSGIQNYGFWPVAKWTGIAAGSGCVGFGTVKLACFLKDNWETIKEIPGEIKESIKSGVSNTLEYIANASKYSSDHNSRMEKGLQYIDGAARLFGRGVIGAPRVIGKGAGYVARGAKHVAYSPVLALELIALGGEKVGQAGRWALERAGLYVNVEDKREKKRLRKIRKISGVYRSKLVKEDFESRIFGKEIVPADFYYYSNRDDFNDSEKHSASVQTVGEMLDKNSIPIGRVRRGYGLEGKNDFRLLEKKQVKLSVDQMIDLYLMRKLKYERGDGETFRVKPGDGDFFVDYKNPLVLKIVDNLERISCSISQRYDTKVLEDHLDNIFEFGKTIGLLAYFFSGVGVAHLIISECSNGKLKNPYTTSETYHRLRTSKGKLISGIRDGVIPAVAYVARASIKAPYWIGKGVAYAGKSVAKAALDPRRYPEYAKSVWNRVESRARWMGAGIKTIHQEFKEGLKERSNWKRRQKKEKIELRERVKELNAKEKLEKRERAEGKEGLLRRMSGGLKEFYEDSFLFRFFGDGVVRGDSIDYLDSKELNHINRVTGAGGAYVGFVGAVERVNEIVSNALGVDALKVACRYSLRDEYTYLSKIDLSAKDGICFTDGKSQKLMVNIEYATGKIYGNSDNHTGMIDWYVSRQIEETKQKSGKLFSGQTIDHFDFSLLNEVIHQYAHRATEEVFGHHGCQGYLGAHHKIFHEEEYGMRRKVVEYMTKNGADLRKEISAQGNGDNPYDVNYHPPASELAGLTHMTRRRLIKQRAIYELEREKFNQRLGIWENKKAEK